MFKQRVPSLCALVRSALSPRSLAIAAIAIALSTLPGRGPAQASIISNHDGTFTDTVTGYHWMDVDTFYNRTYTQDLALVLPGYSFATTPQLLQLMTDTTLSSGTTLSEMIPIATAMGAPQPTPGNQNVIWGLYGNGTYWAYYHPGQVWTTTGAYTTAVDLGAFVVETTPVSSPEPFSLSILGAGLVGLGVIRRRRAGITR